MKCIHCQGEMRRKTAPFSVDRNGYHVSWDQIPAWVCTQCGEPMFDSDAVEQIQKGIAAMEGETSELRPTG